MRYMEYNEKKQHGIKDFPIQLYVVGKDHAEYVMPLHWHKELEIIRIVSGKMALYVNNVQYSLNEGDVAFVNCKHLHRSIPFDCKYECIVCDLAMMVKRSSEVYSSYINPIIIGDLTVEPVINKDSSKLYDSINRLFDILENVPRFYELSTMSELFSIFEQLYKRDMIYQTNPSKKTFSQANMIADLVSWIDENHSEHITLELLAKKSGLTPNYLCRIFKEYTSKTPIEYVNSVRIDNICHDIKWGEKSITEAAIDNGYNDISYFCKVFKKHKGVPAKKYLEM